MKINFSIWKKKIIAAFIAGLFLLSSPHVFADGTNDPAVELQTLVAQINAKIAKGDRAETDFAPEIKQFDDLLAEHKGEKTDAVAQILYMKAVLYGEVLGDDTKADALIQQLKTDFKGTQLVGLIEQQEAKEAAAKKIRDSLVVGTKFPVFSEQDSEGKPLSISDHKGKVLLVDFWATWCGPCRIEMPNVIAAYQKYHGKGFDIIGISLDEDKQALADYTQEEGMSWPQFFDGQKWDNKLAVKYGVESVPTTYLLDGNGNIIAEDLRGDDLDVALAKALASK
ncbi:MAG TPA: redoxin family protein [Verrucomicrobiae bacterium]|jgi:thiol-disulfide isomerase/thioredoxin